MICGVRYLKYAILYLSYTSYSVRRQEKNNEFKAGTGRRYTYKTQVHNAIDELQLPQVWIQTCVLSLFPLPNALLEISLSFSHVLLEVSFHLFHVLLVLSSSKGFSSFSGITSFSCIDGGFSSPLSCLAEGLST